MEKRAILNEVKSKIEEIGYDKLLSSGVKELGGFIDWINKELEKCDLVDIDAALCSLSKSSPILNFSKWKTEDTVNNQGYRKIEILDKNEDTVFEISIKNEYTASSATVGYFMQVYYEPERDGRTVEIYNKMVDINSSPQTLLKEAFWVIEGYMKTHNITE